MDLTATTELLEAAWDEAAWELGAYEQVLEKIQPGQVITDFYCLSWIDDHYENLPVPTSNVPFCLYATVGFGGQGISNYGHGHYGYGHYGGGHYGFGNGYGSGWSDEEQDTRT